MHVGAADVDNRPFIRGIPLIAGDPVPGVETTLPAPSGSGSLRGAASASPSVPSSRDLAAEMPRPSSSVLSTVSKWLWPGSPSYASSPSSASALTNAPSSLRMGINRDISLGMASSSSGDAPVVKLDIVGSGRVGTSKRQDLSVQDSQSSRVPLSSMTDRPVGSMPGGPTQSQGRPSLESPNSAKTASTELSKPRPEAVGSLLIRINR